MTELKRIGYQCRSEIKKNKLVGYASVFDTAADMGSFLEFVGSNAFKRALDAPDTDVRALFNHDPSQLLGRQSSGTLSLGTDSRGLEYEVDLPNTTVGRDVRELAERGDLNGSSFGFIPDEVETGIVEGRSALRHTSVKALIDVSPVTFPAYGGADVALRHMQFERSEVSARSQLILARHRVRFGNQKGL